MNQYDLSPLKVLVVDSQLFMRNLITNVLRQLGVRQILAVSGVKEAFEAFNTYGPDLVITDWAPALNGMELTRRIRMDEASSNPYAPIIMVTAHSSINYVFAARDSGITEFLRKPLTAELLYKRICSVIENQRIFVRSQRFFGPDRRRRRVPLDQPDRRQHGNVSKPNRRVREQAIHHLERRQSRPGYAGTGDNRNDGRQSQPAPAPDEDEDIVFLG